MNGTFMTRPRRAAATLMLLFLVLMTAGCDVHVGWSAEYDESLSGRTPTTFASGCDEIAGALNEVVNDRGDNLKSSCTMPNGDAITCDWQGERCRTACDSSEQQCAPVRDLASEPFIMRRAATASPEVPVPTQDLSSSAVRGTTPAAD